MTDAFAQELQQYLVSDLADSSDDDKDLVNPVYTSILSCIGLNGIKNMTFSHSTRYLKYMIIFSPFFQMARTMDEENDVRI